MPDLNAQQTAALIYWPQIEYAAASGMNTADLWSTIRDAATEAGFDSPGVTIQGVSWLRGQATRIQRAAEEFAAMNDTQAFRASNVATAPWSRSLAKMKAAQRYQIRFVHTFLENGVESSQWRTIMIEGKLPRTTGDIRALVEGDAQQLAKKYGVTHVGSDSLQILQV